MTAHAASTTLVARLYRLSAWATRLGHLRWAVSLQERAVIEKREAWHAAWLGERR